MKTISESLINSVNQQSEINNKHNINWNDLDRDDLKHIPIMEKHNWKRSFHYDDIITGRIYPHNPPQKYVTFVNDKYHIWKGGNKWIIAICDRYHYIKQKEFNSLMDALNFFINNKNYFN